MSTNYNALAEALDRMAVQQEAITEAAKGFRAIGSLDQAIEQRKYRLTELDRAVQDAERRLAGLRTAAENTEEQLEEAESKLGEEAAAVLSAARDEADRLIGAAEARASTLRAEAAAQAAGIVAAAQTERKAANHEAAAAVADMHNAITARDSAMRELEAIHSKMSDARAKLRELIGE